jgi:hypothetical protein
LAKSVFGKDVDKLIAVQVFDFRSDWKWFLDRITPDPIRKTFFEDYYIRLKNASEDKNALDNFMDKLDLFVGKSKNSEIRTKIDAQGNYEAIPRPNVPFPIPNMILEIFKELKKPSNVTLRSFLDSGADEILLGIVRMEDYRRALEATKQFKKEESEELSGNYQRPIDEFLLELLRAGRAQKFSDMRLKNPYIYPTFSGVDLSNANLSGANLLGAKLYNANLSGANLIGAIIVDTSLPMADFSNTKLNNSIIIGASNIGIGNFRDLDFSHAIIDDENLSLALNELAKNVPPAIKNRKDLRKDLEERGLSPNLIDEILSHSSLKD